MIARIRGVLKTKRPTEALVEVGGVTLRCRISLATFAGLPGTGQEVELVTELVVREDGMDLYGFTSDGERTLFGLLVGVSGVGPRMAQGILSGLSVEEFTRALAGEDLASLTSIKGVGRKTAERLILELKDKLSLLEEAAGTRVSGPEAAHLPAWHEEAVLALRSLGYTQPDAEKAVRRAADELQGEPTVETVVKRALTMTR